jgi:membrane fusion protein (multidrug efflux system)
MANIAETQERESQTAPSPRAVEEKPRVSRRRSPAIKWLLILLVLGLAAAGYWYWGYASARESTDDAQIDGHVHPVAARIGGAVVKVLVDNNQFVQAGTVLVEIDPRDYQVARDRARADLSEAQANLDVSRTSVPITSTTTAGQLSSAEAGAGESAAKVSTATTEVDSAQARLGAAQARVREAQANSDRAARDLERMKVLVAKEEISRQQYDASVASAEAFRAQVDTAQAQVREAEQGVQVARSQLEEKRSALAQSRADVEAARTGPQQVAAMRARAESSAARVQQMQAAVQQAELNLQYATVRAPISGIVSQRAVEAGQVVQSGQPLLSVVPLEDIWVTANFKEGQLAHMRPGQPATISVDAYGRKYNGHVDSIAAATGARFSLLPPENATGNYVKVVQRVPVKIVFEKGQDPDHLLRPGMSVSPTVITR